jgi:ribosomal protein L11 methyltransferase
LVSEPAWLEISLIVNGELAEAVAEVLARFAPNGVVLESTQITDNPDGSPGQATGPLRVFAYLPVDAELEEKRQRLEESLWYLGRIQELPEPEFKTIEETNWMEAWKQHYRPIPVGEKLLILPAWLENPQPERIPIKIDPGMAFGTGTHPTTQLSLELLEKYLQPGDVVLDIGCGSAILSIAAVKLGAEKAYGVDVDAKAIESARGNLQQNGAVEQVALEVGSVGEIENGLFPIQQAPVVVANILAPILIKLLDAGMGGLLTLGGVLLLSGILDEKEGEMLEALEKHSLQVEKKKQIEDWIGLVVRAS